MSRKTFSSSSADFATCRQWPRVGSVHLQRRAHRGAERQSAWRRCPGSGERTVLTNGAATALEGLTARTRALYRPGPGPPPSRAARGPPAGGQNAALRFSNRPSTRLCSESAGCMSYVPGPGARPGGAVESSGKTRSFGGGGASRALWFLKCDSAVSLAVHSCGAAGSRCCPAQLGGVPIPSNGVCAGAWGSYPFVAVKFGESAGRCALAVRGACSDGVCNKLSTQRLQCRVPGVHMCMPLVWTCMPSVAAER